MVRADNGFRIYLSYNGAVLFCAVRCLGGKPMQKGAIYARSRYIDSWKEIPTNPDMRFTEYSFCQQIELTMMINGMSAKVTVWDT